MTFTLFDLIVDFVPRSASTKVKTHFGADLPMCSSALSAKKGRKVYR